MSRHGCEPADPSEDRRVLRDEDTKEWVREACGRLSELLLDHANCELKAASTALSLIYRYPERRELADRMSGRVLSGLDQERVPFVFREPPNALIFLESRYVRHRVVAHPVPFLARYGEQARQSSEIAVDRREPFSSRAASAIVCFYKIFGGPPGTRTPNQWIKSPLLYQLS